jgi:hypothetical protein
MTWDAYHRRDEVLRAVIHEADVRVDGTLPTDVPGVAECFPEETALIGALQLRWHTRLAGMIDRTLMDGPTDLESAVMTAWRRTAADLPGVRAILDRYADEPTSESMRSATTRAQRKDRTLLAAMAGRSSPQDPRAAEIGRDLEQRARAAYRPTSSVGRHRREQETGASSLLGRLKAHLPA